MNIRVDLNTPIKDGTEVVFRSPVDCSQVTGLKVYYIGADGNTTSQEFMFADAHGNNVGDIDHLFAENVAVKVILDVTTGMAFVQNADTNAYLEGRFAELEEQIAAGGGGSVEGAVLYTEQTLTNEQQAQARENIGAVDSIYVDNAVKDKAYELIDTITLEEDAVLNLTQEPDGTPYAFERVLITGVAEVGSAAGELVFGFNGTSSTYARGYVFADTSKKTAFATEMWLDDYWKCEYVGGTNQSASAIYGDNYKRIYKIVPNSFQCNHITKIGTYKTLAAGSIVKIYAIRKGE